MSAQLPLRLALPLPEEDHAPGCRFALVWCEACELHLVRCECGTRWPTCPHHEEPRPKEETR